jgi:hypothetical protein
VAFLEQAAQVLRIELSVHQVIRVFKNLIIEIHEVLVVAILTDSLEPLVGICNRSDGALLHSTASDAHGYDKSDKADFYSALKIHEKPPNVFGVIFSCSLSRWLSPLSLLPFH